MRSDASTEWMQRETGPYDFDVSAADPLALYRRKRNFGSTPEPSGELARTGESLAFVIQKHAATRLHYDFRLELDGVMLSWAVPKGPSFDPTDKRMAVRVEDHPVSYNSFEGTIPKGHYGAGTVIIWDRGTWVPVGDPHQGLEDGKLVFALHGEKLAGLWELVRIGKPGDRQMAWILFKKRDRYVRAKTEYDVVSALPDSVGAAPAAATSALDAAVKAPLPDALGPQLATLATGLPRSGQWKFEVKFDGYRLMTRIDAKGPKLITRGGHDWSKKMPALEKELRSLGLTASWLDGEIVVLDAAGLPSFNALQRAFDRSASEGIVYFLFDVPFFEGHDLRRVPLNERRALLKSFLDAKSLSRIRYAADFDADPASILHSAEQLKLEGLIAKRSDAPYVSGRTETWLKLKVRQRQEFVIAGYTDRGNDAAAREIGSLLLAVHDEQGALVSAGGVGAGWDSSAAVELKEQLLPLQVKKPPFADPKAVKAGRWSQRAAGAERWVRPQLVAEVAFADWTPDGHIRHATFVGLRADKPAEEVRRERAAELHDATPIGPPVRAVKVTHPERVIDPSTGATKLDLVRYYESVAKWMLPHLQGRPCSLVRGPSGIEGELFFQKHLEKLKIDGLNELDRALWPEHASLLEVAKAEAIAGAAQLNTIEFHTWNATIKRIDRPDRMIFDLDPGEGVGWKQVQDAAAILRSFLGDLQLQAWLKTSGGKGLHVVVPLATRHEWDMVKGVSEALVQHLARIAPARFVAKSGAANRVGKIFVDYLRNSFGATTAAAYSARARPGLGVSMPIAWDVLPTLKSGAQWGIATAREHLSFHPDDPWADYWSCKQTLTKAAKLLDYRP